MAERIVKIGLVGFGTIGCGVAKLIAENADSIAAKTGLRLKLACVVDVDTKSKRPVQLPKGVLTNDLNKILDDDSIEIGIELVGGTTIAKDIQLKLLGAGKDVVTANKALLSEHGNQLYQAAHKNNKCIAFEASCVGGVPIISGLRTGLVANKITDIYGIVNGTCNYILSNMSCKNVAFAEALAQAQQKGFAEADPTLDISGGDSAHKLAILSSLAFGYDIVPKDIYVEGIEGISQDDIRFGDEMGYVLKLLAIAQKNDNGKISLRVHPSFIAKNNSLALVDGSFNAISVFGNAVGHVMYYGRGAGMMPTASAVVADIIDVALGNSATTFRNLKLKPRKESAKLVEDIDNLKSRFYIRMMVKNKPGAVGLFSKALGDNQISISGVLQHEGNGPDNTVPVVVITHLTTQKNINNALKSLKKLNVIKGKPVSIKIVDIPEDLD